MSLLPVLEALIAIFDNNWILGICNKSASLKRFKKKKHTLQTKLYYLLLIQIIEGQQETITEKEKKKSDNFYPTLALEVQQQI